MEINSEILSALALINSAHIDREDLLQIFDQCNKTLTNVADRDQIASQLAGICIVFACKVL